MSQLQTISQFTHKHAKHDNTHTHTHTHVQSSHCVHSLLYLDDNKAEKTSNKTTFFHNKNNNSCWRISWQYSQDHTQPLRAERRAGGLRLMSSQLQWKTLSTHDRVSILHSVYASRHRQDRASMTSSCK